MENNIRQIRQVFKNLKMQVTKNSDSREMSRRSSRVHSRRGSIDFLEEEEEEEYLMRSKSGSIFGSRDEIYSRSRTRSGTRSDDDDEVMGSLLVYSLFKSVILFSTRHLHQFL